MEDSIERIREDIDKEAREYWGCYDYDDCESCPSKRVDEECSKAYRIELVNRTRALFERQLPEGVEWPRFEDGELMRLGDMFTLNDGSVEEVRGISFGKYALAFVVEEGEEWHSYSYRVKRAEPEDTQEKIDADAEKSFCEYFGHGSGICKEGDVCEAYGSSEPCRALMIRDLLRRQRELCEREAVE